MSRRQFGGNQRGGYRIFPQDNFFNQPVLMEEYEISGGNQKRFGRQSNNNKYDSNYRSEVYVPKESVQQVQEKPKSDSKSPTKQKEEQKQVETKKEEEQSQQQALQQSQQSDPPVSQVQIQAPSIQPQAQPNQQILQQFQNPIQLQQQPPQNPYFMMPQQQQFMGVPQQQFIQQPMQQTMYETPKQENINLFPFPNNNIQMMSPFGMNNLMFQHNIGQQQKQVPLIIQYIQYPNSPMQPFTIVPLTSQTVEQNYAQMKLMIACYENHIAQGKL